MTKTDLRRLVSDITVDTYEALAPQLGQQLQKTQGRLDLTDEEKSNEILLDMMGYIKSCTNEILIEVLAQVLDIKNETGNPEKIRFE